MGGWEVPHILSRSLNSHSLHWKHGHLSDHVLPSFVSWYWYLTDFLPVLAITFRMHLLTWKYFIFEIWILLQQRKVETIHLVDFLPLWLDKNLPFYTADHNSRLLKKENLLHERHSNQGRQKHFTVDTNRPVYPILLKQSSSKDIKL